MKVIGFERIGRIQTKIQIDELPQFPAYTGAGAALERRQPEIRQPFRRIAGIEKIDLAQQR